MRTPVLFIICIGFFSTLLGQEYEIGVSLGGTNYVGDIGRTNYIFPNKLAGNVFLKYNYNPRIALKATFSYLPIAGNDAEADTDFRQNRGLRFSNTINELALGLEFNFYEYELSSEDKSWTPYILAELAVFNYSVLKEETLENKTAFAIPLDTKFRYTFKDDLDFVSENNLDYSIEGNSNDWYMFTGVSLIYTFGRPACYTKGL
jgi:hypothetical protein